MEDRLWVGLDQSWEEWTPAVSAFGTHSPFGPDHSPATLLSGHAGCLTPAGLEGWAHDSGLLSYPCPLL